MLNNLYLPIVFSSFLLVGCQPKTSVSNSPLCAYQGVQLSINKNILSTYIACSNQDKANGLMHRTFLEENTGMIFLFKDERLQSFWMKNTLIDLSIAFVDSNWKIVDIREMQANDLTPVVSNKPALYAIEANKNWFSHHNINVGDTIKIKP